MCYIKNVIVIDSSSLIIVRDGKHLSSEEQDVLTSLYLPLIKSDGLGLYLCLNSLNGEASYLSGEKLLSLTGFQNDTALSIALHKLEGVGLVITYRYEDNQKISYIVKVLEAYNASKFFSNEILSGGLLGSVGEAEFDKLKMRFFKEDKIPDGYIDVSSNFFDVYDIAIESLRNIKAPTEEKSDIRKAIEGEFSIDDFISEIKELQDDPSVYTSSLSEIKRLSSLYALTPKQAALIASSKAKSDVCHFDINAFEEYSKDVFSYRFEDQKENINSAFGTSDFSNKVFQMEHSAPKEFLMRILKTSYIPDDYLTLINELSSKGNLSHALINCILDYTFEKCQGKLPSEYVKKVASSLKYQNIRTASDAMAFLYQQDLNYAKKKRRKKDYVQDSKGDSNVVSVSKTSQKEDENETNDYWSVLGGRM